MEGYLLGIDNGGTVTKAALFDTKGNEICVFGITNELQSPKNGFYERDMESAWQSNIEAITGVIKKSGVDSNNIVALSMTGYGGSMNLVNKQGKPMFTSVQGADARALSYLVKWQEDGTQKKLHPLTWQNLFPAASPLVFLWMRDNMPEMLNDIGWYFSIKDYIRYRLTGEAYEEITNYSGSIFMNMKEMIKGVDVNILKIMGLEEIAPYIPPIVESTQICGSVTKENARLTGLKEGTPVVAGCYDITASSLASGVVDESKMCMIVGTWCNNGIVSKTPIVDDSIFTTTVFVKKDHWLVLEGSPTSASNLAWLVKEFLHEEEKLAQENGTSVYDICSKAILETEPEDSEIIFLPLLYGGAYAGPNADGTIVGLRGWHERKHVIRAIYEGICFSHRYHCEKLAKHIELPGTIRLSGGASKSKEWVQMFADVFEKPVELTCVNELGALGACICAAVGIGVYDNFDEAVENMVRQKQCVLPDKSKKAAYDKKYLKYKKLIECMKAYWE